MDLFKCGIDDDGWRVLVNNANLFESLKAIYLGIICLLFLGGNNITTVKDGDLERFKKHSYISFNNCIYNYNF